jgi:sugar lactone lactonase YvrE
MVQFSASQLAGTTSAAAAIAITTGSVGNFGAVFDNFGDLWRSTYHQDTVETYSPYQLSGSGAPASPFAITVFGAAGLVIDPSFETLWVASSDSSALWGYYFNNIYYGYGPPYTPDLVISAKQNSLSGPTGIAFDSQGNLWVANGTGNTLVEYSGAQLNTGTGGTLTPAITLTANSNSIRGPMMIAFDASGDLWVANGGQANYSSVVEFSAAQLAASGSPTPNVTLSPNAGSLNQPAGLAFDNSGDLWVSNMGANTVVEFTPSQIASSGSPTPSATVSGASLNRPVGLAFNPPALNLPLSAAYVAARAAGVSRVSPRGR